MYNLYKILFTILLLFICISSKSEEIYTPDGVTIDFIKQNDENYPLVLQVNTNKDTSIIDKYPFEGGEPNVEDFSFLKINNQLLFVVLISWEINHYDIKGVQYQTFIYEYKNKTSLRHSILNDDNNLSGFSGYTRESGDEEFKYKTIDSIKKYLTSKLNLSSTRLFSCSLSNNKTVNLIQKNEKVYYTYGTKDNIELAYPTLNESSIKWNTENKIASFNRFAFKYSITQEKENNYSLSVKNNNKIIFYKSCVQVSTPFPSNISEYFQ